MYISEAAKYYRMLELPGVGDAAILRLMSAFIRDGKRIGSLSPGEEIPYLKGVLGRANPVGLDDVNLNIDSQIQSLEEAQVGFLGVFEDSYPVRLREALGNRVPPILSYVGNLRLLDREAVGFCGSRKASSKGIETTQDCAQQLVNDGFVVVSGYAGGVDIAAHAGALRSGGSSIFILPEGILRFRIKKQLRELWDWDRCLVISEFAPGMPWAVRQAMKRNLSIIGLSHAMIVIEAGETGGTMAAGSAALDLEKPLYAAVYEGMPPSAAGNAILIHRGAKPLFRSRSTGRAALDRLKSDIRGQRSQPNLL